MFAVDHADLHSAVSVARSGWMGRLAMGRVAWATGRVAWARAAKCTEADKGEALVGRRKGGVGGEAKGRRGWGGEREVWVVLPRLY